MGYLSISNLYKDQTVLMFREVYALEKLHGTSAHIIWQPCDMSTRGSLTGAIAADAIPTQVRAYPFETGYMVIFSGGASVVSFESMLNPAELVKLFAPFDQRVEVYGELYGGSQQKQAYRYGPNLKFCAFDVKIGETWLTVPDAEDVCKKLGLEFVHYDRIPGTVEACDEARDKKSVQAWRNGMGLDKFMEGVVIRPLIELTDNRGNRVIAKHKRPEERETATERKVDDPAKLLVLAGATEIANEWVTETRLDHVLDKIPGAGMRETGQVLKAMLEDVFREAGLEIVDTKEARDAITTKTRLMFHARVKKIPT